MDCVDNLCLPTTAKLWLYQHLIVAKLSWPFTSLDLSLSFAKHLQALAAAYLKHWSGLPHPANVNILYTGSSKRAGLRITHLATFWKQMQAVRLDILQQSSDCDNRCSRLFFFFFFFLLKSRLQSHFFSGELWSILVVRLAHSADLRSRLRHVSSAPCVAYSTGCSRVITHPGTNPARRCLTSVI